MGQNQGHKSVHSIAFKGVLMAIPYIYDEAFLLFFFAAKKRELLSRKSSTIDVWPVSTISILVGLKNMQTWIWVYSANVNPTRNYMLKVNDRNTIKRCEICSKLTIKIPERCSIVLVSLLFTLNIFHTLF